MSPRQEIAADLFGVKVLEQTGFTLEAAKDIALTLIKSHPEEAETCWGTNGVNSNTHPATQTRVDAINALS